MLHRSELHCQDHCRKESQFRNATERPHERETKRSVNFTLKMCLLGRLKVEAVVGKLSR